MPGPLQSLNDSLEKQFQVGDQHRFFQDIKPVQLEERKEADSQCVRDEEGRMLRDKGVSARKVGAILPLAAEREI